MKPAYGERLRSHRPLTQCLHEPSHNWDGFLLARFRMRVLRLLRECWTRFPCVFHGCSYIVLCFFVMGELDRTRRRRITRIPVPHCLVNIQRTRDGSDRFAVSLNPPMTLLLLEASHLPNRLGDIAVPERSAATPRTASLKVGH